jgi:hypothetical protein
LKAFFLNEASTYFEIVSEKVKGYKTLEFLLNLSITPVRILNLLFSIKFCNMLRITMLTSLVGWILSPLFHEVITTQQKPSVAVCKTEPKKKA